MALWGALFLFQNDSPSFLRRDTSAYGNHFPYPNKGILGGLGFDAVGWGYEYGYDSYAVMPNYSTMRFVDWYPLQKVSNGLLVENAADLRKGQWQALATVRMTNADPTDRQRYRTDFAVWVWDTDINNWTGQRVIADDLSGNFDSLRYLDPGPTLWVKASSVQKPMIWSEPNAPAPPDAVETPTKPPAMASMTPDYAGGAFLLIVASVGLAAYLFGSKPA